MASSWKYTAGKKTITGTFKISSSPITVWKKGSDGNPLYNEKNSSKKMVIETKTYSVSNVSYIQGTKQVSGAGTSTSVRFISVGALYHSTVSFTDNTTDSPSNWFFVEGTNFVISKSTTTTQKSTSSTSDTTESISDTEEEEVEEVIEDTGSYANYKSGSTKTKIDSTTVVSGDLLSKSMNGIFGLPYQWMDTCDMRLSDSEFGRMYATKIAARMPLLFLTPGTPAYLPGADDDTVKNIKSSLIQNMLTGASGLASSLEDAVTKLLGSAEDEGCNRYYSFDFAYDDYYQFVNPMCQISANLLGLTDRVLINGSSRNLTTFAWQNSLNSNFSDYFSAVNSIPFYIDGATSVSESFNNDTTTSMLANAAKSVSSTAKEMNFLMGTAGAVAGEDSITEALTSVIEEYQSKLGDGNSTWNLLDNVRKGLSAVASGGAMLFPDIWDNSSFGRSYSVNIKLRSPDCDNLSIYLNVLVPLYHLIGMVAPHTIKNNYNTYSAPFLVRAYCKGMFNIDMGIITSMDVSKGKEGSWNANGLPTEIDVSLTIKDLYEVFSITALSSNLTSVLSAPSAIVRNTAMMDYLCNTIGLNLNKSEIQRGVQVYLGLMESVVKDWPSSKWLQLQTAVDNKLHDIFSLRSR
jgi:hypothetical protein